MTATRRLGASKFKFRQKYEREMIDKNDTHFYVGNIHQHPDNWLIVGLFYPSKQPMGDLFDTAFRGRVTCTSIHWYLVNR